jgi:hypothetical protein
LNCWSSRILPVKVSGYRGVDSWEQQEETVKDLAAGIAKILRRTGEAHHI